MPHSCKLAPSIWTTKLTYSFCYTVEADEIRRLSKSFKKLDMNQNGSLSVEEFMAIPELQQNPLVRRVIDILDTDRNGEVDFQGWGDDWCASYDRLIAVSLQSSSTACRSLVLKGKKRRNYDVSMWVYTTGVL